MADGQLWSHSQENNKSQKNKQNLYDAFFISMVVAIFYSSRSHDVIKFKTKYELSVFL